MRGRFSTYQASAWLDALASRPLYMALFTQDPYAVTNPLSAELIGTSINRQPSEWTRTSSFSLELNNDVFFAAIPPETSLVAIGAFDAPINGNIIFRDIIDATGDGRGEPLHLPTGGTFGIAAGDMVIGLDIAS